MRLALLLGAGRERSAKSLIGGARRAGVPGEEIDRWVLLGTVTDLPQLADESEQIAAATRLADGELDSLVDPWLLPAGTNPVTRAKHSVPERNCADWPARPGGRRRWR